MVCRALRAQAEQGLLASMFYCINAPTGLQGSLYFSSIMILLPKHFIPLEGFFPCWMVLVSEPSHFSTISCSVSLSGAEVFSSIGLGAVSE